MRFVAIAIGLSVTLHAAAQGPGGAAPPSAENLDRLVSRHVANARAYDAAFRNLTAEETKTSEEFARDGRLKQRRVIVSDLVVYQSPRDRLETTEYRDIQSVDGKPIEKRGKRALELFGRVSQAKSLEQELELIDRESQRYELHYRVVGSTVHQVIGTPQSRIEIAFHWVGREQIESHDVNVIDYVHRENQSLDSYHAGMGVTAISGRGRLWLDAETAQLRRARWELVGQHPAFQDPIVLIRSVHDYADSRLGILVPQRIVFEWFESEKWSPKSKQPPSFTLAARTAFTYGAFRKFEVTTQEVIETPR